MRKGLVFIVVIVVFGTAFASNPSHNSHKQKINVAYSSENLLTGLAGVGEVLGEVSDYNNYVLFSTTYLGDRRMSIGILGKVYATPPDAEELTSFIMRNIPPSLREKILREIPESVRDKLSK